MRPAQLLQALPIKHRLSALLRHNGWGAKARGKGGGLEGCEAELRRGATGEAHQVGVPNCEAQCLTLQEQGANSIPIAPCGGNCSGQRGRSSEKAAGDDGLQFSQRSRGTTTRQGASSSGHDRGWCRSVGTITGLGSPDYSSGSSVHDAEKENRDPNNGMCALSHVCDGCVVSPFCKKKPCIHQLWTTLSSRQWSSPAE